MRQKLRPGDILLTAAILLLAVASAHQLERAADARQHHTRAAHVRHRG